MILTLGAIMLVKGTAVLTLPLFIQSKFGEDAFQDWLSHLTAQARDVYTSSILPTNWYPVKEILVEPTRKVCELFYKGSMDGAWELGRFSAEHGLKGIYKVFVKFGSVQFMIRRATTILPTYYDSCRIDVVHFSGKHTVLHITKFQSPDEIIEQRIGGWMERALEICGCNGIKVDITKSLAKGDPVTEYHISWN